MAVAALRVAGVQVSLRGFHPPKTATVTAWYRAAVGQMPDAPEWRTVDMGAAVIDQETITWHGEGWDLFVARRRSLR